MRMPPSVSFSRPVTSALILPRSRKSGRSRLNAVAIAKPNAPSATMLRERELPVQVEQVGQREHRGDQAADQLHQAVADEVPDALGVGHDPRDQDAGLGRVEVADRQPRDVRLDPAPHVGDRALRRDAEDLRQRRTRSTAWTSVAAPGRQRQRHQQLRVPLPDDVVDEVLRGGGQDEAGQPVDQHAAPRPRASRPAVRDDQRLRFGPGVGVVDLLLRGGIVGARPQTRDRPGALASAAAAHPAAQAAARPFMEIILVWTPGSDVRPGAICGSAVCSSRLTRSPNCPNCELHDT